MAPDAGEFFLDEERWPATLADSQRDLLRRIIEGVRRNPALVGLAAAGSFRSGAMDEFSDLDLVVVVDPSRADAVRERRASLAAELGPLLSAFTGEHVGEPRLLICLYGAPVVHVDLKFLTPEELSERVEDPVLLWDRDGRARGALEAGTAAWPDPDPQWIEDRFWTWVHYAAAKIGRGELFEALDFTAFLREKVLGPLALREAGVPANGVRRVERDAPARARQMRETVARYDARDLVSAVRAAVALYRELRDRDGNPKLRRSRAAEAAAIEYLDAVARKIREPNAPATPD